jgi:Fur family ferric uptake transcriptional regulator|tara:strand:- start:3498 stop:3878 length:381 start_codon:yes stop_codon:yes gene_type:complete
MGIIRKTQAVALILDEFEKDSNAISAIELIKRLNKRINKTTVYRLLDKLQDDGLLHNFLDFNGVKWFAKCKNCSKTKHQDVHPHFQCISCGNVDCLKISVSIPEITNRKIINSHILVLGQCDLCMD